MLCPKCKTNKNQCDFSSKDYWCRDCRRKSNRRNYEQQKKRRKNQIVLEGSTLTVAQLLWEKAIPSVPGGAVGCPWVDLMAWGCVPIEAKCSSEIQQDSGLSQFMWQFTPRQRRTGFDGFFVFVALFDDDSKRVFVVPSCVDWIQINGKPYKKAVAVTFDSTHGNAWVQKSLELFEDRYDLLGQAYTNIQSSMADVQAMDYRTLAKLCFITSDNAKR